MPNINIHVKVYSVGQCPRCKHHNKQLIYDYGLKPYREMEKEMDHVNHEIHEIKCKRCSTVFLPQSLIYMDTILDKTLVKIPINYDHVLDPETRDQLNKAHKNRFKYFKEHEAEFWDGFIAHALQNWRDSVNELQPHEIILGLAALGITHQANTTNQFRREVLNKVKTTEQKTIFWRAANQNYIYNEMLDIGPMGWDVESEAKRFGLLRTRYVVLNWPMEDIQERLRTDMIAKVVRKDRGDNAFLFSRISQLSDDNNRLLAKLRARHKQIQELRVEIEVKNKKLNELYQSFEKERKNKTVISRDPNDIRKIHELKNLVAELIKEQPKETETEKPAVIEESPIEPEITPRKKRNLSGLTIGIIGGERGEQAKEVEECTVLTHEGMTLDNKFYALLNQSDELVILTKFVSHAAMWAAKAHAITEDKPIYYTKSINLYRILDEIKS